MVGLIARFGRDGCRPHITTCEHLRNTIYGGDHARALAVRGSFVEDVVGRAQMEDIKQHGLSVHAKYGTWVLAALDDQPITYHLNGRKVRRNSTPGCEESRRITQRKAPGVVSQPLRSAASLLTTKRTRR